MEVFSQEDTLHISNNTEPYTQVHTALPTPSQTHTRHLSYTQRLTQRL